MLEKVIIIQSYSHSTYISAECYSVAYANYCAETIRVFIFTVLTNEVFLHATNKLRQCGGK